MKNLLIAALLVVASSNAMAKKTTVSGTIKGFKNDTLTIYFLPLKRGETPITDQVVCKDGKLNYEVQLVSPLPHLVRIGSNKWENLKADADPYGIYQNDIHFFLDSGDQINFSAEPGRDGIFVQASGNEMC